MAVPVLAELYLSDGTEYINLLSSMNGFAVQDWRPAAPEAKGGGVWQDSPLSESRRLVARQYGNAFENFTLAGRGGTADLLIQESQRIRRLLEKAVSYWTSDWQDAPVYLLARGVNETNVRYCLLYDYRAPGDGNPFASPFTGPDAAIFTEWSLILERGHWTETPPGQGTAVQVSGLGTFNSVTYGRAATTTNEVYLANKQNKANITHIFVFDASAGTFSANLFGSALPYRLFPFPAGVGVGDILYAICDTSVTDSGPFSSIVWDIGIALADITFVYEIWTGAAFAAITVQDNTNQFQNTGVNSMHWQQPSTWATTAINGITGYIIRFRVTVAGGAVVVPTQQNRQPYSITWASGLIDDLQVGGDIPALALHKLFAHSGTRSVLPDLVIQRAIIGLRSTARGSSFVPAINFADEQNPTGITAAEVASAATSMVTDARAPSGRAIRYNIVGAGSPDAIATIDFASTIATQFYGRYRAFLRLTVDTGTANDITLSLYFGPSNTGVQGRILYKSVTLPFIDEWLLVDFGQVVLPASNVLSMADVYPSFDLQIGVVNTANTDLKLYDLWLIPVDENALEGLSISGSIVFAVIEGEFLESESILYPKAPQPARAIHRLESNEQVVSLYQPITAAPVLLQANAEQRVHVLTAILDQTLTNSKQQSFGYASLSLQTERQQRYLSMRGTR